MTFQNQKIANRYLSFLILLISIVAYGDEYFAKVNVQGGEIHHIEVCSKNSDVIYAGSQKAGLWISKDGGQTWSETNFFKTAGTGTNVFAVHSQEPNIIIAAGVKPESQSFYTNPQLYRSEDYGQTWQTVVLPVGGTFTKIVNAKKYPDEFYLLVHSGPDNPIVYKSTDKGQTWTQLSDDATHSRFNVNPVLDMTVDNNNNLWVTVGDNTPPIGNQIGYWLGNRMLQLGEARYGYVFISTNNVNTFSSVATATASFQTSAFEYEFSNPAPWSIVSGSKTIVISASTIYQSSATYSIYAATSTDESVWQEARNTVHGRIEPSTWTVRGIKFTQISTTVVVNAGFAMAVSQDGQKIYCYDPQKRKVLVSTFTAGVGFSEFFDWSTGFLDGTNPIQANDFVIDPTNPNKMYIADQSRYGVLISTDGGKTWSPSNNGINGLIVYDGCKGKDKVLYVLTKMAVYKSADGTNWSETFSTTTPQGTALELDEGTIASPKENLIIVAADGYVYRSEDGGTSWDLVLVSSFPVAKSIVFRNDDSGVGYVAFREGNPGAISGYTTSRKYIYKTVDWGKTWTPLDFESMSIQHLVIDPKNPKIIYVSLAEITYWESRVYKFGGFKKITDNDDGTVSPETITGEDQDFPIKVFINPDDPNIMYGATIMYTGDPLGSSDIYGNFGISINGGKGWFTGAITYPIQAGELSPSWNSNIYDIKYSSGILYWATSNGVFALIDNTTEVKWLAKSNDLGTAKCLILGSLYTGTSTGLYKLAKLPSQLNITIDTPRAYSYPNPCDLSRGQKITMKYLVPQGQEADWLEISIYNLAGELVYEIPRDETKLSGGFGYYYEWDGKNKSGKTCARGLYIALFKSNLGTVKTKIVLVK